MRRITALLQTKNDGLRLGRCLETLYPCDDILVIDHESEDDTVRVAREYGAQVVAGLPDFSPQRYVARRTGSKSAEWILLLDARESLTESLAASLYEWKTGNGEEHEARPRAVFVREETAQGWTAIASPQTRLVPAQWGRWQGAYPQNETDATALEGDLLRFLFP
jgi:glycosyltransferase involved in cell wall biosynthesis